MNMKNILRLMGALALTTGAATSVVACGQKAGVAMNVEVSNQLGLTNDKGEGVQAATLDASKADVVMWSVPALATPITADKLLVEGDKAANQSCFDFITKVLNIKPKEGTKVDDGVFDKSALAEITSEVTNITPTLQKVEDNKDYAVTDGTFSFQFKKGETKLGDVYGIKLKVDATAGVIEAGVKAIADKIKAADTDVTENAKIKFKDGEKVPAEAKPGVPIAINDKTDDGKQFASLNKLTDLKIAASLGAIDPKGEDNTWASGGTLEILYKAGDVTFEAKTTLTL